MGRAGLVVRTTAARGAATVTAVTAGCGPGAAAKTAAPGPRLSCQLVTGSAGHGTAGLAFCTSIWNSAGNHCPAGMSNPGMEFVG